MSSDINVATINTRDLDEFRVVMRRAMKEIPIELQLAHDDIAVDLLKRAKARGRREYSPSPNIVFALDTKIGRFGPSIIMDSRSDPRIFGAEFGAYQHFVYGRKMMQDEMKKRVYRPWTGNPYTTDIDQIGYAVYPTIREAQKEIYKRYLVAIQRSIKEIKQRGL